MTVGQWELIPASRRPRAAGWLHSLVGGRARSEAELWAWYREGRATSPEPKDFRFLPALAGDAGADDAILLWHAPSVRHYRVSPLARCLLMLHMATPEEAAEGIPVLAGQLSTQTLEQAFEDYDRFLREVTSQATAPPSTDRGESGYNLSLNAGMACNLACSYCDPLGYREKTRGQVMTPEVAARSLGFFFGQVPPAENGCVTFSIGGEPLIYRALLDRVVEYTRELRDRGVRATQYLNTNGLLLSDGVIDYLQINGIRFGVSMDGPPEMHDRYRHLADGTGTYRQVEETCDRVLSRFPFTTVSAVLTADDPNPLAVYRHLLGLGFQRIIVKPVRGRPGDRFAFTTGNVAALIEGYREYAAFLTTELLSGNRAVLATINPHDYFGRWLIRIIQRDKHGYRCGAASLSNLTVSPDGAFYPCEGFIGQDAFRLGHVDTGFDEEKIAQFDALYVDRKPGCRECWARYQCGGGCYLSGHMVNDDITTPDPAECELNRALTTLSIQVLDAVGNSNPEVVAGLLDWCKRRGWHGTETLLERTRPEGVSQSSRVQLPVLNG